MVRKDLEKIIGKLHYNLLVVLGEVDRLYHLHHMPTQGDEDRAWILPEFHQDIGEWLILVNHETALPIHLADIMGGDPTHLGFCDISIIGAVGIWIDPYGTRTRIMWCHPWLEGSVSEINPGVTTTNYDLDLTTHVPHKVTLLSATIKAVMAYPNLKYENTPTVYFSTRYESTINPVVADLLRIKTIH